MVVVFLLLFYYTTEFDVIPVPYSLKKYFWSNFHDRKHKGLYY